jgi:imidazolonepropionase-like amidohydrolase
MRQLMAIVCSILLSAGALADSTAFVNVNVISMTDESLAKAQTVIVRDGRIEAIGAVADTELPDDAFVIDGTERYLMPGLTEMHGHVTSTSPASLEHVFGLYIANGITTVRGMLGQASHLALREKILRQAVLGPRLVTSGPSFNGNSVSGPGQAERMVREQKAAGYDFLKIHPGLSRAEFAAVAATANEVGIPFAGHVPEDVGVDAALAAGIASIDHLDGYMETLIPPHEDPSGGVAGFFGLFLANVADEERIATVAESTAAAGVWNVPTETLFEHTANDIPAEQIANWPEMKYVRPSTLAQWVRSKRELLADPNFRPATARRAIRIRRALILALHEAGAGLLLGSDAPQRFNVPGFSIHRELLLLVDSGLTPFQALQTGTVNAAEFLSAARERGTIEVGRVADLVLLDENPLDDIRNSRRVHGTMLRGRWVSRPAIDAILQRAERH